MKEFKTLTKTDKQLICQAAMDMETGNDLLGYPRSQEYADMRHELAEAYQTKTPNERQSELIAYFDFCRSVPED